MQQLSYFELVGFGPNGWGLALLTAAGMTIAVALCGFLAGSIVGTLVAWGKIGGNVVIRSLADGYTTVLRGIPDLLVIYLFYFGGSAALGAIGSLFGAEGFIGVPAFATGAMAIGIVSGAYQAEVFRGAYQVVSRGELEAARSVDEFLRAGEGGTHRGAQTFGKANAHGVKVFRVLRLGDARRRRCMPKACTVEMQRETP